MKKNIQRSLPSFNKTQKPAGNNMRRHDCTVKCTTPSQRMKAAVKRSLVTSIWPTLA